MGVKLFDLCMSYLSDRNQVVHVNNTQSDPSIVTCGVQQGGILGPPLVLWFLMTWRLVKFLRINLLYADDSAILYSPTDPAVIFKKTWVRAEAAQQMAGW